MSMKIVELHKLPEGTILRLETAEEVTRSVNDDHAEQLFEGEVYEMVLTVPEKGEVLITGGVFGHDQEEARIRGFRMDGTIHKVMIAPEKPLIIEYQSFEDTELIETEPVISLSIESEKEDGSGTFKYEMEWDIKNPYACESGWGQITPKKGKKRR